MASPVHHTAQAARSWSEPIAPETRSVPAPIVALIGHAGQRAEEHDRQGILPAVELSPEAHPVQQGGREKWGDGVSDRRHRRGAGSLADRQVDGEGGHRDAGHIDLPSSRNAATAMPVGGQSGVTLRSTRERLNPSRAPR